MWLQQLSFNLARWSLKKICANSSAPNWLCLRFRAASSFRTSCQRGQQARYNAKNSETGHNDIDGFCDTIVQTPSFICLPTDLRAALSPRPTRSTRFELDTPCHGLHRVSSFGRNGGSRSFFEPHRGEKCCNSIAYSIDRSTPLTSQVWIILADATLSEGKTLVNTCLLYRGTRRLHLPQEDRRPRR
jgi:hypothetical protein